MYKKSQKNQQIKEVLITQEQKIQRIKELLENQKQITLKLKSQEIAKPLMTEMKTDYRRVLQEIKVLQGIEKNKKVRVNRKKLQNIAFNIYSLFKVVRSSQYQEFAKQNRKAQQLDLFMRAGIKTNDLVGYSPWMLCELAEQGKDDLFDNELLKSQFNSSRIRRLDTLVKDTLNDYKQWKNNKYSAIFQLFIEMDGDSYQSFAQHNKHAKNFSVFLKESIEQENSGESPLSTLLELASKKNLKLFHKKMSEIFRQSKKWHWRLMSYVDKASTSFKEWQAGMSLLNLQENPINFSNNIVQATRLDKQSSDCNMRWNDNQLQHRPFKDCGNFIMFSVKPSETSRCKRKSPEKNTDVLSNEGSKEKLHRIDPALN